jgi:nucleoside 2-deoxyribosyltransferase
MTRRKMIYLAAPLFSRSEKMENERVCRALERWCDVFLPQRDGELVPHLMQQDLSANDAYRIVFDRDMTALRACDALVINLDGRSVDEGAAFELGCAHMLGKCCVGYRTDVRVLLPWGLNPMVTVPLHQIFTCVETIEIWAKSLQLAPDSQRPRLVSNQDS